MLFVESFSRARSSLSTDPLVLLEVIQSGKVLGALVTRVEPLPTVLPLVSSEILWAEKAPLATRLFAHKGLLSSVFLNVDFKVIGLCVRFLTVLEGTVELQSGWLLLGHMAVGLHV